MRSKPDDSALSQTPFKTHEIKTMSRAQKVLDVASESRATMQGVDELLKQSDAIVQKPERFGKKDASGGCFPQEGWFS